MADFFVVVISCIIVNISRNYNSSVAGDRRKVCYGCMTDGCLFSNVGPQVVYMLIFSRLVQLTTCELCGLSEGSAERV